MIVRNININIIQYGNKKGSDIVFLHGWGNSTETMDPIAEGLKENFHITLIDLPGMGESEEPGVALSVYEYADILKEILNNLKIINPIIFGHSFGGRIAIIFASKNKVSKLILSGSPYKKTKNKPSFKIKVLRFLAKFPIVKNFANHLKNKMGSIDYQNATPIMKQILVKAIHEDLTICLKKIKCPTLLIWGRLDTAVTLEDAKELEKSIKDCGLVVYENRGHFAYLEENKRTIIILKEFLKGDVK